jgi:4-amino-4-deoxy-L-arabinose transferase-like glycosyltransferase
MLVAPRGAASPGESEPRPPLRTCAGRADAGVVALTIIGGTLRIIAARQSLFGDELSTYWISATHSLGGVLSLLYSHGPIKHAEITPPLSFLASWLTTRLGQTAFLLRIPSIVAGTATIPLVYALGLRSVGRRAALLAAALTCLSPFMIYYSSEARAYGLLMFFVVCAVISMLQAVDTGRRRYWVAYALASAAAFYTHYTCIFVLAVALLWLLWAHPSVRRQALAANIGGALLVVPWIPGLINDLRSPTVKILSAIAQFTPGALRVDIGHWALGYPYALPPTHGLTGTGLTALPGVAALVLLGLGGLVTAGGLVVARRAIRARITPRGRVILMGMLMVATLAGECIVSALGSHIVGVREFAASWPFLALFTAFCITAAGGWAALAGSLLVVAAFVLGVTEMLQPQFQRPDYQAAAGYVTAHAHAGDVVIDETGAKGLTPGPLTGFDVAFRGQEPVIRALAPAERRYPFFLLSPVPLRLAIDQAVVAARGHRIFVVGLALPNDQFPASYGLTTVRRYPGLAQTLIGVYTRSRP